MSSNYHLVVVEMQVVGDQHSHAQTGGESPVQELADDALILNWIRNVFKKLNNTEVVMLRLPQHYKLQS